MRKNTRRGRRKTKTFNDPIPKTSSLEEFQELYSGKANRKVMKKTTIFTEDEASSFLYFVISGKVKIYTTNKDGKEFIRQIYKKGDFFGYLSLLDKECRYRETATAIEDSEIAMIPKEDFYTLLYSNNEASMRFIQLLTNNLADAQKKLLNMAYSSAKRRVVEALLFLYQKYKNDKEGNHSFPFHRENISAIAGIALESTSRNLKSLKDEGLIETSRLGNIRIIDLKKLEDLIR